MLASPNDLSGGTGVARPAASTVGINPANAARVPATELSAAPNLFERNSLQIRYPGSDPITKSSSGIGDITSWMPSAVFKVNDDLGIGGYAVPPVTVEREYRAVPIVVLGALDTVDIKAKVSVKGAFGATFGYALSERLALGLQVGYSGIAVEAQALPSSGGSAIATILLETSSFDVKSGVLFDLIPDKLRLGASFGLFAMQKTATSIESALLGSAGGEGDGSGGKSSSSSGIPMNRILFGAAAKLGSKMSLFVDVEYNRAGAGAKDFSFVDLAEKEKDVYSTVSPRVATAVGLTPRMDVLASFKYQPANVGPGGRGDGSKAGYGSREVIGVFTGMEQLNPYWAMSLGARHEFGRIVKRRESKDKDKDKEPTSKKRSYAKWMLGYGFVYQRGSLGIDENGELPGAYLQTKLSIPIELTYRL